MKSKQNCKKWNFHLGMDLTRYGITHDNVKEKVLKYQR